MADSLLLPAFAEPVVQTQETFRLALKAMSEPGTLQTIENAPGLGGLMPATYALCLSLFDSDTSVWLAPAFDTPELRANLAFHCACPVVNERPEATFALLSAHELDDLSGFDAGTDRDPDQSCTLIIQLPDLERGSPICWQGPGIEHDRLVRLPVGLAFWHQRKAFCGFPKGLDSFFTSGKSLVALPRSTRVSPAMQEVI